MKEVNFTVSVTAKDMFRFQLYHTYFGPTGVLLAMLCVVAIYSMLAKTYVAGDWSMIIYIFIILWAVLIFPLNLYNKSKSQIKRAPLYQKPLDYRVDDFGMHLVQEEQKANIPWKDITKVVIKKHLLIFYIGKVRAHLVPLDGIPEQKADLIRITKACCGKKVKGGKGIA